MGAQLSHALSLANVPHRVRSLGIRGEFGQSAYVAEHLYEKHGLTAAGVVELREALSRLEAMGLGRPARGGRLHGAEGR